MRAIMNDGRELLYFFDQGSEPLTPKPDTRDSEPRPETNQLRQDPLTGEWISISPHRGARAFLPPKQSCPLCPSTDEYKSEIPGDFDVAVFENKNPSFGPLEKPIEPAGNQMQQSAMATGRCEVVVFSPEHVGSLAGQTNKRFRTVVDAWVQRTQELKQLSGVEQVFIFENRGEQIGVTLHHPHGQIYCYPFITPTSEKLRNQVSKTDNFFEKLLKSELGSSRELLNTDNFVAFVPFAARWPIEIQILPKRHVSDLTELSEQETEEFAGLYQKLLASLDRLYDSPTPYIAGIHQAPKNNPELRLMVKITSPRRAADKLKYLAGSESAMGAFISDTAPETIAEMIRGVL